MDLPLQSLDLTGVEDDIWVTVPRCGPKRGRGKGRDDEAAAGELPQAPPPVEVMRVERASPPGGAARAADSSVVQRGDTAQEESSADLLPRPSGGLQHLGGGGRSRPPSSSPSATSLPSPGALEQQRGDVQHFSVENLRQLVANPLSALRRSRECQLHLRLTYVKFDQQEIAAAAGGQGGAEALRQLARTSRVRRALESGVLQVHIDKAEGLVSKATQGWTKNMVVKVGKTEQVVQQAVGAAAAHCRLLLLLTAVTLTHSTTCVFAGGPGSVWWGGAPFPALLLLLLLLCFAGR